MTQDKKALHLGGARVRVAGRHVGQVMDATLIRDVTKAEHMTNVNLEFRRDFVIPIETRFGLNFTFGEVLPYNANLMLGMPGYRGVPIDRKLSGNVNPPFQFIVDPRLYTEYPTLYMSLEGQPVWAPMVYTMGNPGSSAKPPAPSVSGVNASPAAPATTGYVGFFVTMAAAAGANESILSSPIIIPHNTAAAGDGDDINLTVTLIPGQHVAGDTIRVYRFTYQYFSAYKMYQGTQSANAKVDLDGIGATLYAITAGDVTNGYAVIAVKAKRATLAGNPPLPLSAVTNYNGAITYEWLRDFDILPTWKTGSAIRRTLTPIEQAGATGTIEPFQTVKAAYYYNAGDVAELPLGTSNGENPVVPMSLEIPLPDGQSKIFIELHRVQVNQSFTFAVNERDWTGIPFTGDALDAEELYPDYPYGYWQVMGPLARRIILGNNYSAFADLTKAYQFPNKTLYT